jgi:8-oxo-dGTP pyrophosphatase MutT (NUDIX family)
MNPSAVRRELRARAQQVRAELHAEWGAAPHRERVLAAPFDRPATPEDSIPWAAVALVCDDGEVLSLREASHDHLNWEPPGGRGDPGERPADTAAREVREETGVDCVVRDLLLTETLCWDHGDAGHYPVEQAVFRADRVGGTAAAREPDVEAVAWHPRDDLPPDAQYRDVLAATADD